jgi:hypothetical protein
MQSKPVNGRLPASVELEEGVFVALLHPPQQIVVTGLVRVGHRRLVNDLLSLFNYLFSDFEGEFQIISKGMAG